MSYELIETIEIGAGGTSSIQFTGIEQDATDLLLLVSGRSDRALWLDTMALTLNGDSTTNYNWQRLSGNGSSASALAGTAKNNFEFSISGDTATANTYGDALFYISNYTSSSNKSVSISHVTENNATQAIQGLYAGTYTTSSAITSIELGITVGDYKQYTTASLYKITAGDSGQLSQPKATGGTVSFAGGYWYHTFTSSGTFTPTESITADYLIVAGGGGSGNSSNFGSGGGGAGGYIASDSQSLSATAYSITVGAGGSSEANGTNSTFNSETAIGGGAGGTSTNDNGSAGGSGGGAAATTGTGGTATSGQGNAGGSTDSSGCGGGGGGAGAAGDSSLPFSYLPGDGGDGSQWHNGTYYAGGGGGGNTEGGSPVASGGIGGGGDGADNGVGEAGATNTGGGGGGSHNYNNGASGGSGIVIVRYAA